MGLCIESSIEAACKEDTEVLAYQGLYRLPYRKRHQVPFIGDSMGINGAFYTAASVLYAYLVAKAFRRQSRGENTSRRHPGCALNWSFKSLHTAVPSSPGAYEMLNCDTSSATTLRTSLRASCFPMQLCLPVYGLVSPMS